MRKITLFFLLLVCSVNGAQTMRKRRRMVDEDEIYQKISRVVQVGSLMMCKKLPGIYGSSAFQENIHINHFFDLIKKTGDFCYSQKFKNCEKLFKYLLERYHGQWYELKQLHEYLCEVLSNAMADQTEFDDFDSYENESDYRDFEDEYDDCDLDIDDFRGVKKLKNVNWRNRKVSSKPVRMETTSQRYVDSYDIYVDTIRAYIKLVEKKLRVVNREYKEKRIEEIDNIFRREGETLKRKRRSLELGIWNTRNYGYYPGDMRKLSRKKRGQIKKESIYNYHDHDLEQQKEDFERELIPLNQRKQNLDWFNVCYNVKKQNFSSNYLGEDFDLAIDDLDRFAVDLENNFGE